MLDSYCYWSELYRNLHQFRVKLERHFIFIIHENECIARLDFVPLPHNNAFVF